MGTQIRTRGGMDRNELLADEWLTLLGHGIIQKKFGLAGVPAGHWDRDFAAFLRHQNQVGFTRPVFVVT